MYHHFRFYRSFVQAKLLILFVLYNKNKDTYISITNTHTQHIFMVRWFQLLSPCVRISNRNSINNSCIEKWNGEHQTHSNISRIATLPTNTNTWTVWNVTFVYQLTVTNSTVAVHHLFSEFTHSQNPWIYVFSTKTKQKINQSINKTFVCHVCAAQKATTATKSQMKRIHGFPLKEHTNWFYHSSINSLHKHEKC